MQLLAVCLGPLQGASGACLLTTTSSGCLHTDRVLHVASGQHSDRLNHSRLLGSLQNVCVLDSTVSGAVHDSQLTIQLSPVRNHTPSVCCPCRPPLLLLLSLHLLLLLRLLLVQWRRM
eukprot:GHRQ01026809.1.p2 GENE.GHRQ01026809.1~~GHRQ01026809.1.p2  ORF type:complete len:118 (-),score=9.89 GHRQ01026809.1:379-732(-)